LNQLRVRLLRVRNTREKSGGGEWSRTTDAADMSRADIGSNLLESLMEFLLESDAGDSQSDKRSNILSTKKRMVGKREVTTSWQLNNFRHRLAAISKRGAEDLPLSMRPVPGEILRGLIEDKGGETQVSTATRILAEVIASDAAWLVVFNGVMATSSQSNRRCGRTRAGLHQRTITSTVW
jgi:hypothetical protein